MNVPICPKCRSNQYVRRSRRGISDVALSLFFLYPFRCESCGHRFYRLSATQKARPAPKNSMKRQD
jgi:ribosomal protein L33